MRGLHAVKKGLLRTAAVAAIALNAGGCSILPDMPSVPDWVDPTTWFGSDSSDSTADNGQTPDLASLPDKPSASTPDDRQKVAESLAADRSHAQYSAEALRGGTEAAAPPPPASAPTAAEESLPGSANDLARSGRTAAPATSAPVVTPQPARVDRSVIGAPTGRAAPGTLPSAGSGPYVAVAGAEPPVQATPAPTPEPASAATPQGSQPAVAAAQSAPLPPPAPPAPPMQVASIAPSDAALGFRASSAPALAPSVAQFVAPPIVRYYQQTAARAAMHSVAAAEPQSRPRKTRRAMGGPTEMSGSVVANLGVLGGIERSTPSVYANAQGLPAAAVVYFPGDSVVLSAQARAKVRATVEQYKARGGQGYIRVVGHSSSRTPNMSLERHLEVIYRKSQERADAVAHELIREGVPAAKVLVEAVGDSQPIYYESMPKGEEGNRRAEIFLQS